VLWAPSVAQLPTSDEALRTWLLRPAIKRLALANPEHAPYGRAAMAVLKHLGVEEKMKDKLVVAENVGQAAQFVHSGNAQAGFVPLSLVLSQGADAASYWRVPQEDYPEIVQVAGVVSASAHKAAAQRFLDYVLSADGAAILQRFGFSLPAKP